VADPPPGARDGVLMPTRFPDGGIRLVAMKELHVRKSRAAQRLRRRVGVGPPIDEGADIVGGIARPLANALTIPHGSHLLFWVGATLTADRRPRSPRHSGPSARGSSEAPTRDLIGDGLGPCYIKRVAAVWRGLTGPCRFAVETERAP